MAHLVKMARERGTPPPPEIDPGPQPQVDAALLPLLQGFFDLESCRQLGGRIPWTAAHAYGEAHGFERDVLRGFARVVQILDSAAIEWHRSRAPQKTESSDDGSRTPPRPRRRSR